MVRTIGRRSADMRLTPGLRSWSSEARGGQPPAAAMLVISACLLAGFSSAVSSSVMAQAAGTPSPAAAPSADDIKQREQELEAVRAQQKSAAELQERLKVDIAAIGQNRAKLNQQLIDA